MKINFTNRANNTTFAISERFDEQRAAFRTRRREVNRMPAINFLETDLNRQFHKKAVKCPLMKVSLSVNVIRINSSHLKIEIFHYF